MASVGLPYSARVLLRYTLVRIALEVAGVYRTNIVVGLETSHTTSGPGL